MNPDDIKNLIPVAVPLVITFVRRIIPELPKGLLPILAPILGAFADTCCTYAGMAPNLVQSALLGAAGTWVYEMQKEAKAALQKPPPGPPPAVLCVLIAGMILTGCARFRTIQTDLSATDAAGVTTRTITTTATASTFAAGKSVLSSWKATQTDRTQGASVGSLDQQADASRLLETAVGAAIRAGLEAAKP